MSALIRADAVRHWAVAWVLSSIIRILENCSQPQATQHIRNCHVLPLWSISRPRARFSAIDQRCHQDIAPLPWLIGQVRLRSTRHHVQAAVSVHTNSMKHMWNYTKPHRSNLKKTIRKKSLADDSESSVQNFSEGTRITKAWTQSADRRVRSRRMRKSRHRSKAWWQVATEAKLTTTVSKCSTCNCCVVGGRTTATLGAEINDEVSGAWVGFLRVDLNLSTRRKPKSFLKITTKHLEHI